MKLLLTCCTNPEFDQDAFELWNKFCIAEWMSGIDLIPYLKFAPASASACVDAIVFLQASKAINFAPWHSRRFWDFPEIHPWNAPWLDAEIIQEIRNLPESCAMRDGRKWKRIPLILLTDSGFHHPAYSGLDATLVYDVTQIMLHSGYASPVTWTKIEEVINSYHRKTLNEYERVGFLVTTDHGRYRVKRAYHKKTSDESEFYFAGRDRRKHRGYVTIGRELEGIGYEASLFEQLLNDPKTGEREVHNFLEGHPDLLAEAMSGVPISHPFYFRSKKQIPDFVISPILPRGEGDWAQLLELKGPEAPLLASRLKKFRNLSSAVMTAIAQVSDYNESIDDPLNLITVQKALGFLPEVRTQAVLIGRAPSARDAELWKKRRDAQLGVSIVTYDEIYHDQQARHAMRKGLHV